MSRPVYASGIGLVLFSIWCGWMLGVITCIHWDRQARQEARAEEPSHE